MKFGRLIPLLFIGALAQDASLEEDEIISGGLAQDANLEDDTHPMAEHNAPTYEYVDYKAPSKPVGALLAETFDGTTSELGWQKLSNGKFKGTMDIKLRETNWIRGDTGLKMLDDSAHHGLTKRLNKRFDTAKGEPLYVSMEVEYEKSVGCGGAYMKLYDSSRLGDISEFDDSTAYSIMFGPDKCGYMTNKVHLIVKYPNPSNPDELIEEHLTDAPKVPKEAGPHQYGFALLPDGTAQMYIDGKVVTEGKMKEVFKTHFENAASMADENDTKPDDWVDEAMIPDPDAVKPEDWDEDAPMEIVDEEAVMPEGWLPDEPTMIPNPDAEKPEDWDDEEDGEWRAPMIKNPACYVGCGPWKRPMKKNPAYKGPWTAPKIANPAYRGEWKPRQIPNPHHFSIANPYTIVQPIDAIGFELWTVESGAMFDNLLVTTSKSDYDAWFKETFEAKSDLITRNHAAKDKALDSDSDTAADSSRSSFMGRLLAALQLMAAENKTILVLTVGVPLMTTAYMLSRIFRRAAHKEAKKVEDEPKANEPKTDGKPAETEKESAIPKKVEETTVRQRKGEAGESNEDTKPAADSSEKAEGTTSKDD